MPLDALPTKKVHAAVWADEFDRVIGHSIATLATFDRLLFCHECLGVLTRLKRLTLQLLQLPFEVFEH